MIAEKVVSWLEFILCTHDQCFYWSSDCLILSSSLSLANPHKEQPQKHYSEKPTTWYNASGTLGYGEDKTRSSQGGAITKTL